jgi:hypothetical protein
VKGQHRTTVVRVLAVASLVVLARSLTGGGEERSQATPPPPSLPAVTVPAGSPPEKPRHAGQRILAEYARYPSLSGSDAEAALRDLASRGSADALVATLHADLARLEAGYPGGATRFSVGSLAAREVAVDENRAKVDIWFCRVVAPPGQAVYAEWRLGGIDLVWERDAWRLRGFEEVPGPRPAALPGEVDTPAEIVAALEGFEPAWP